MFLSDNIRIVKASVRRTNFFFKYYKYAYYKESYVRMEHLEFRLWNYTSQFNALENFDFKSVEKIDAEHRNILSQTYQAFPGKNE